MRSAGTGDATARCVGMASSRTAPACQRPDTPGGTAGPVFACHFPGRRIAPVLSNPPFFL